MREPDEEVAGTEPGAVGPWGAWATLGFSTIVFLAVVLAHTIAAAGLLVIRLAREPGTDLQAHVDGLAADGLALAVGTLVGLPLGAALILLFCSLRRGPSIGVYLGLTPLRPRQAVVWLGACGALVLASDALTALLGRPLVPEVMVRSYRTAILVPVYWLALVVAAPLFEEMLFRGFLLEGLRRSRPGNVGAAVLTSLAWAAVHIQYGPYELATIFGLGLVLAAARLRSGSLYLPILMHAALNLVSLIQTALLARLVPRPGAG